jgi:hypothetical protein
MQEAFDLSSVRQTLRKYLDYRWTLEQLDRPSGGWDMCEREWRKHKLNLAKTHRTHRNLLRSDDEPC